MNVNAEDVLILNFGIDKNDTVNVIDVKVSEGKQLIPKTDIEEYKIHLIDNENNLIQSFNIIISFYVFDLGEVNESAVYLRLPWKNETVKVFLLHNDKKIHEIDLRNYICNSDGVCSGYENKINCPKDCKELSKFPWWILILVGPVVVVAVVIIILQKNKSSQYQPETPNLYNNFGQ